MATTAPTAEQLIQAEQIQVMRAHGGWPDEQFCPTHGRRRCEPWIAAWVLYEKSRDRERVAAGHSPHYAYSPRGNTTS